jgi:hypothetical protein
MERHAVTVGPDVGHDAGSMLQCFSSGHVIALL